MPCYMPKVLDRSKVKDPAVLARKGIIYRPCGRCIGCRLATARMWAIRMMHEAQCHEENCFITLTYDPESLPDDGSLVKAHLQQFIKNLRRKIEPKIIKFYACGEYGARLLRPHYHVCIFGYDPPDKELLHKANARIFKNRFKTDGSHDLFTSKIIEDVWQKGFITIGDLSLQSAGYVARYVTKKVLGKEERLKHYKRKIPEFALMSRKPGIGAEWFKKHKTDCFPKDFVTFKGVKYQPPRYYENLLRKESEEKYQAIKDRRFENMDSSFEYFKELMRKEKHKHHQTRLLKRNLENAK